jgi:hypothetical protein
LTFVFKHPNYYKNLATNCRRDNKPQKGNDEKEASSDKQQASSDKHQASGETESSSN